MIAPPAQRPVVILIGLRASGKTTVGRLIGDRLGVGVVDLDDRVAEAFGVALAGEALREHGERAFRLAETTCLREALDERAVLALGGGTPTAPGAEGMLRACGSPVVYLHADPVEMRRRLGATDVDDRPSLTGTGTLDEIDAIYESRHARYHAIATECGAVVETGGLEPEAVAAAVIDAFRAR